MGQKRVTYFSAFASPSHHIVHEDEVDEYVQEGKDQQFKVRVTEVDEPEPTHWE